MEHIKAATQALREAQKGSEQGWAWSYDEVNRVIRAKKGRTVRKVFTPHTESLGPTGSPTPWTRGQSRLVAEALNITPKMLDALDRTLAFIDDLEAIAKQYEQDADSARAENRQEDLKFHLQSVRIVRSVREALLEDLSAAFPRSPGTPPSAA